MSFHIYSYKECKAKYSRMKNHTLASKEVRVKANSRGSELLFGNKLLGNPGLYIYI